MLISIIILAIAIVLIAIFIFKIVSILDKLYSPFDEGYINFYKKAEKTLAQQKKLQKQIEKFNSYLKMRIEKEKQIAEELKDENKSN